MRLYKVIFIFVALLFSTFADAGTKVFDITEVQSYPNRDAYPGLDLSGLEHLRLTSRTNNTTGAIDITRLDLKFPNASNLVFTDFNLGNYSSFYATINDGWVYRKLIAELGFSGGGPTAGGDISIRLYVAEKDFLKSNYTDQPEGLMLVDVTARLVDITPNPVADTHWMKLDDKGLSLKLYRNPEIVGHYSPYYPGGFKLDLNWFGHGARTVYIRAPVVDDKHKAVALIVTTMPDLQGNLYSIEIEYEDEAFNKQTYQAGYLVDILRRAYQL